MPRVIVRPRARRELQQIATYFIENASLEVARRFRRAATDTFHQLAEMPDMGSPRTVRRPEFAGVRMWRVKGFESYLVFYFPAKDGIAVERVIHAKQDYKRMLG